MFNKRFPALKYGGGAETYGSSNWGHRLCLKRLQWEDGVRICTPVQDLQRPGTRRGCNTDTGGEKHETCAHPFRDHEEKSRWLFLTQDGLTFKVTYKCLLERGIQSHLASGFTVLLYCWEQERQEKFLLFSHRRISICELAVIGVLEMGKKFYQSSSELRVTEKPNPAGLEKRVCRLPYRKVQGQGEGYSLAEG